MNLFTPEDFINYTASKQDGSSKTIAHTAADAANAKLAKLIEDAPVVYGINKKHAFWGDITDTLDTHKARLMFIEPIVKEPCKHEPYAELEDSITSKTIYPGKIGFDYFGASGWRCKHCGIPLEAKWEPKNET